MRGAVMVSVGLAAFVACGTSTTADPRYLDDDAGNGDASADTAPDRGAPPRDAAPPDAPIDVDAGLCSLINACNGARDLGNLAGDTGAEQRTTQGTTSEWLRIRMTENDTGLGGAAMKATITLVSPAGANYDLFVYFDELSDVVECTMLTTSSTQQGGITDSVHLTWGEQGLASNGSNDSRTVNVQIRWASGTCNPADKWTLFVDGNK